ncbi:MAG TPA: hypothetical protein VIH99_02560 [Bdellovibrionota bacterium]
MTKTPEEETSPTEPEENSHISAAETAGLGASRSASISAVCLAEGANTMASNPAAGGYQAGECLKGMNAAEQMRQLAEKNLQNATGKEETVALEGDKGVLGSTRAEDAFNEFENRFKVSREDFLKQLFKSPGSADAFATTLEGQFSHDAVLQALENGSLLSDEEKQRILARLQAGNEQYVVALGRSRGSVRKTTVASGLREQLRRDLAEAPDRKEEGKANKLLEARLPRKKMENVTPLREDPLFTEPAQPTLQAAREDLGEEGTIFEVVHRKYRDRIQQRLSNDIRDAR